MTAQLELIDIHGRTLDELAAIANREHELAWEARDSAIAHALACGAALNAAKAQVRHGKWLPWLAENFKGSEDTAERFMLVARNSANLRILDARSVSAALRALGSGDGESSNDSLGTDEYYTPRWIFDTLDIDFDLDVAAPGGGPRHVPAARWYTDDDDGLSQPWAGRVWMNPPYSNPTPWVARFLEHGNGIALLPFAKSEWFFDIWRTNGVTLVAPGIRASHFDGGQIYMATFLAAIGPDDIHAAARRLGVAR